ncbi:TerD family protein [Streptomyces chumphonensis]|uniref:TerD family protein n=1 Tax=Streptomyces chumphonensis TaxID=1214925 RepID=UPI003D737CE6
MAREFQRGHKARLSDLTAGTDLYIGVQITGPGLAFDISCFGLDADERLSDDRYFVFYNQPESPEGAVRQLGAQAGDTESFRVTFDAVPDAVRRLSFTATIDGDGQMSQVAPGYLRIVAGGEEVARYAFDGSEFTTERAVMLGDFYVKDVWRFAAVGQGFDGGLAALLQHFGGEVAEEAQAQEGSAAEAPGFAPPAGPAPAFAPPPGGPPSPPPAPAPVQPPAPAPVQQQPAAPVPQHAAPTIAAPMPAPVAQPPGPPQPPPGSYAPPGVPAQASPPGFGQQPPGQAVPGGYGVPQQGGAGLRVSLEKYREVPVGRRWTLQNGQLVRADLGVDPQPVLARQGSMVLYQGDVDFSYKSAGFVGRVVGQATGQEMQLMRCAGRGQVFFADDSSHLHPIELQGDGICVSAENVLAFDETLHYEVRRIEGHGIPGGVLFTMQFQGTGTVVVKTHGTPVVLPVTPMTYADAQAVVAWSSAAQVIVSSQVRLRRTAYPGHSGESVNLQFRGAPGNFIVVQPYEV